MPEDVTDRRCCHKCHTTVTGKKKLSKCAQCHSITYCGRECQRADWPRHSQFCIPVMVTEIPDKGKGLVASKDFKKGQVVFQESAAIIVHAPSSGIVPLQELKDQISKMSEEQKNKFYQLKAEGNLNQAQLASAFRENCLHELDIFDSNAVVKRTNGDKIALFLSKSLMNHSCAPNVHMYTSDADDVLEVRAIKDILKGEEVTRCYKEGFMTSSQMKMKLKELFLFDCKCGVCSGSIPHQDVLISEISSKITILFSQPVSRYQKKKDWMNEASEFERIVDLSKQLYIGHIFDRLKVHELFVLVSQMARDPIRLKKAMDVMKEELSALGLMEKDYGKGYKILEATVEKWSSEFQSKSKPTKEEIDDFFID